MSDKMKHFYEFEDFRLDAASPSLWRGKKLVSISPKALETLILLVEKNGAIVTREEMLEKVWENTFVEDGNINYTISLLRKTLGNKELIQTVARRGYRFTSAVRETSQTDNLPLENSTHSEETSAKKTAPRLILVSVFFVSILFLTSFALWFRTDKPAKPTKSASSENSEAMQAYTRGKMILAKKNSDSRTEKAIDEFQIAVTLDPTFAPAYSGLAEGFLASAVSEPFPLSNDYYTKAKVSAEKALALDPQLSEGFQIRGWIKRQADWDWKGAEEDLRHAIQLDSKNAKAHQRMAQLLSPLGRADEALAEFKLAYELDPVADFIVSARFPILESRREYDLALKESEQFLRENKNNTSAARAYAMFLYHTQNYAKVIEISEQVFQTDLPKNTFAWLSLIHASYYKTGQFDKAAEYLKQLESIAQDDTKALYSLAMNYAEIGRNDEAITNLEKCFERHEERMVWLKVEPRFENLRSDPRFKELVQKMRLNA